MKKEEKSLVQLNAEIIDQFENGEEMLLIKGGKSLWQRILDLLTGEDSDDDVNGGNCYNCSCE